MFIREDFWSEEAILSVEHSAIHQGDGLSKEVGMLEDELAHEILEGTVFGVENVSLCGGVAGRLSEKNELGMVEGRVEMWQNRRQACLRAQRRHLKPVHILSALC